MDPTERTRARFSAPIPGFPRRLRSAIAARYSGAAQCGEALGLPTATLTSWVSGRTNPKHVDDLVVLSEGLGVSIDWLVFGAAYEARDWPEATMGQRLQRAIDEHFGGSLLTFRERLGVTPNMVRRWTKGIQRPDLYYLRNAAAICRLSLDWLVRGEPWEVTLQRLQGHQGPTEVAARLANRLLEGLAGSIVDPACAAHALRIASTARHDRVGRCKGGPSLLCA